MILREGVRLIVTIDGLKEDHSNRCDTETLLYFEQQLDMGDGVLTRLVDLDDDASYRAWEEGKFNHRFTSIHGGNFHVRAEEGCRAWNVPEMRLPDGLVWLKQAVGEAEVMQCQIRRLMAANRILEDELAAHRLALTSATAYVSKLEKECVL